MARYSKGDPREGGFYALWAKQWLDDEKLKTMSKELKCCFSEVMACAQLIDFVTGRLERGGFIQSEEAICARAGITIVQLKALYAQDLVGKDSQNCVFIKNWHKWQNPDAKKGQNNLNSIQIKSELNPDLIGSLKASDISHHKRQTATPNTSFKSYTPTPPRTDLDKGFLAKQKQWAKEQAANTTKTTQTNEDDETF